MMRAVDEFLVYARQGVVEMGRMLLHPYHFIPGYTIEQETLSRTFS
jgi:hypothetical protein